MIKNRITKRMRRSASTFEKPTTMMSGNNCPADEARAANSAREREASSCQSGLRSPAAPRRLQSCRDALSEWPWGKVSQAG